MTGLTLFLRLFVILSVFAAANGYSHKAVRNWHCSSACNTCPTTNNESFCMISPFRIEFPCLCLIHHSLCRGFAQTAVFYEGACNDNPYIYLDDPNLSLLTFRDGKPVILRHQNQTAKPPKLITELAQENSRKMDDGFNDRMCQLFYRQDRRLKTYFENKHFQCVTVDASKTMPLPPLEFSETS